MGRYKFSDPRAMPKFGAGTNPFKGKTEEKKEDAPSPEVAAREETRNEEERTQKGEESAGASALEPVAPRLDVNVGESGSQSDQSEVIGHEAVAKRPETGTAKKEEEQEKDVKAGPGWISRVGSLTNGLRMKLRRKPRQSAPPPRPIQGELSLDNIKPVRNDLSETDLEVVPLRTSAIVKAKARAKTLPPEAAPEPAETAAEPALANQQPRTQPQEQDLIEAGRT